MYVNKSTIPFAGEGLFAVRDIPENINFVLNGGLLLNKEQTERRFRNFEQKVEANELTLDMWYMEIQSDANLFLSHAPNSFFEASLNYKLEQNP